MFFAGTQSAMSKSSVALVLTFICVFTMLISTSTAGYIMLLIFLLYLIILLLAVAAFGGSRMRLNAVVVLVVTIAVCGMVAKFIFDNYEFYRAMISFTLQKQHSLSYAMRASSNDLAQRIFLETSGIGIGLGGHRASGLIYNILAAFGVVGMICFAAYVGMHLVRGSVLLLTVPSRRGTVGALTLAGLSGLSVAAVSAGEITTFTYYLPFAMLSALWISHTRAGASCQSSAAGASPAAPMGNIVALPFRS
jgi:hypothetical protein